MGNCWSCIAGKSNPVPGPDTAPVLIADPEPIRSSVAHLVPVPIPDPDPIPSSVAHLIDGDTSFLGSNFSANSWFSMATTNLTQWMSQASGAIAAIWGEDNQFLAAIDDEALPDVGTATDSKLRAFTFEQLKAATFNFRGNMLLGKGGFGNVYKGWLKENVPSKGTRKRAIAIKRLESTSKQGFRQWRTEVGFLARLSHPNIVKLLGYCRENEELLIVYEFMEKGSLNYHLFGKGSGRILPWEIRLKIAIGMARALSHLHMMEKPIIFRDFKSSNVLLDGISDFGLAKWGPTNDISYVTGHVMGTIGYAAPEYVSKGLRAIDKKRPIGQHNLVEWARPRLSEKRKLKSLMDPKLDGKYAIKQACQLAHLATMCLDSGFRPSMKEVTETLEKIEAPAQRRRAGLSTSSEVSST